MWKMVFDMSFKPIITVLVFPWIMSCIFPEENDEAIFIIGTGEYQYNLADYNEIYPLPGRLQEISGLAYWKDDLLLCVQDEKGNVYVFDKVKKEIVQEIDFGKKGDYEGITCNKNTVYVVRSDGNLYSFEMQIEPDVRKRKLPFTKSNDVEGLCMGHNQNELYIACKGSPEISDKKLKGRAVYQFDLDREKLRSRPYIHLTTEVFTEALEKAGLKPTNHMPFMSSGIAIHPITEDVFLISSVGRLLVVLNKKGDIKSMAPLKRSIFIQPEGICFDASGNLFIASEGKGRKGYILKFESSTMAQ